MRKKLYHADIILTTDQVAKLLQVHQKTVYKLVKEGKLPGHQIGGSWRFSRNRILEIFNMPNSIIGEK